MHRAHRSSLFRRLFLASAFVSVASPYFVLAQPKADPTPAKPAVRREPPPSASSVQSAIDRAKARLYALQKPDGTWENLPAPDPAGNDGGNVNGTQWGGLTSIALYALLAAGENPNDARLEKAIEFLRNDTKMTGLYAVAMRAQVWSYMPDTPENKRVIARDGSLLLNAINRTGAARGLYRYHTRPENDWDNSASQIGVLGVWALSEKGFEPSNEYWQIVDAAWRSNQRNGGWAYDLRATRAGEIVPTMTAAGVATLFLTQDFLHASEGLACRGNLSNKSIEDGLAWMGSNLDQLFKDENRNNLYAWYGVERIGVASGYKYLGPHDWYSRGAGRLLSIQNEQGGWDYAPGGEIPGTSFALLFLVRGRAPVVMNKLDYNIEPLKAAANAGQKVREGNWNERPRDVANVVRFISRQTERTLNWQITDLSGDVSELLDSSILYISGNQPLNFTPDEEAKLKSFLEQGGLILANADCSTQPFTKSVRELGKKLFPAYDFRELPEDHPIYTRQQFPRSKWKQKQAVLSLGNDVRELIVLFPNGDPARVWQLNDVAKEPPFQFMADLYLYTVDKTYARTKGESYLLTPRADSAATRDLRIARIQYPGNWNPEPAGWTRFATHMLNNRKVGVKTEAVELSPGKLKGYQLAHLTGTKALKLDDAQLAELKEFVNNGGTLLVEAAGGRDDFSVSLEDQLAKTFGDGIKDMAKPDNPLYTVGGAPVEFSYRSFVRTVLAGSETKTGRLHILQIPGKGTVIFSREDLSAGLVGNPIDGIYGYSPNTALDLVTNIALWALGDRPAK
jgi:hypothetical protein